MDPPAGNDTTVELHLDQRVAHYWPEFAAKGKARHHDPSAALPPGWTDLRRRAVQDERRARIHDSRCSPRRHRAPLAPGIAFGYHGITLGVLMAELVRRITGDTLQQLYEIEIRASREIDFFIGLPAEHESRFREVLAVNPTSAQAAEVEANLQTHDTLTSVMSNSPFGEFQPTTGPLSPNRREVRAAGPAALGGVGSARGLAQLYTAAVGANGDPVLSSLTIDAMSQQQAWGIDRTLHVEMCFGVVFMKHQSRMEFGSYLAFGHDGAGGALAFADPLYRMGFGYVPNPMHYPGGADTKGVRLSQIARACARRLP